jgi:DUF218 domain
MHVWRRHSVGLLVAAAVATILLILLLLTSGSFLIVDQPRRSDVIVVLAGEAERRPARGFELLGSGFAPHLVLDVPVGPTIYNWSPLVLAQKYVDSQRQSAQASVCPIYGRSTKAEAKDVARCLAPLRAHSVLLVTSDYHTRRAVSVFRNVCPQYEFSVAGAFDDREFGPKWWQHRQWAKINFDEWIRLIWWEAVDRWR